MALNMSKSITAPKVPDYAAHLGESLVSKPIISQESSIFKKQSQPDKLPDSNTEHAGVLMKSGAGYLVSFLASRTINLGNYESCKIEVGITVPCEEKAGLDEAYQFAEDFCGDKIEKAVNAAKGL